MNQAEIKEAIPLMRAASYTDKEIEEELGIRLDTPTKVSIQDDDHPGSNAQTDLKEALWVSCPKCDALPGDVCFRDSEVTEVLSFTDFWVHFERADMLGLLSKMKIEEKE